MRLERVEEVDVVMAFSENASDLCADQGRKELVVIGKGIAAVEVGETGCCGWKSVGERCDTVVS